MLEEEERREGNSVTGFDLFLKIQQARGVESQLEQRALKWVLDAFAVTADYLVEEILYFLGELPGGRNGHGRGRLFAGQEPHAFLTPRQIIGDEHAVSLIYQISGPISRDETLDLGTVKLVHAQHGVQAAPPRVRRAHVLGRLEPGVPVEVTKPRHTHRGSHRFLLPGPCQQMFQQGVAETEALLRWVDVQRQHMGDRTVGAVQTVGGVERDGVQTLRALDALGVDDTLDRAVGLDDELAHRMREKALPDDFFGDPQTLRPAQLLKFEKPGYIREAGVANDTIVLLNHVYVRPVPRAPAFLIVERSSTYSPTTVRNIEVGMGRTSSCD
nr:hypothetical protein [Streptomyces aurantiacus]